MIRPSKIDIWIALLLVAGPLILVNLGIYLHKTGEEQNSLICISAGMLIGVVTWILAFPCQYTLEDKSLLAQAEAKKPKNERGKSALASSINTGVMVANVASMAKLHEMREMNETMDEIAEDVEDVNEGYGFDE